MSPQTFRRHVKAGEINVARGPFRHSPWKIHRREIEAYQQRMMRASRIKQ